MNNIYMTNDNKEKIFALNDKAFSRMCRSVECC